MLLPSMLESRYVCKLVISICFGNFIDNSYSEYPECNKFPSTSEIQYLEGSKSFVSVLNRMRFLPNWPELDIPSTIHTITYTTSTPPPSSHAPLQGVRSLEIRVTVAIAMSVYSPSPHCQPQTRPDSACPARTRFAFRSARVSPSLCSRHSHDTKPLSRGF